MKYSKEGKGWGRGDSDWACDSKFGNCTDFHSLFISLARSQKIPAKFEIGFPLPDKRGAGDIPGYHCWAKFRRSSAWGEACLSWPVSSWQRARQEPIVVDKCTKHELAVA